MPNIRISKETLGQLRQIKALFSLETEEEYSFDKVIRMMAGDMLSKILLRSPGEIKKHVEVLEKIKEELKYGKRGKAT
jgi:hypothetical protein